MLKKLKIFQKELSKRVKITPLTSTPRYIAGVDVGYFSEKNLAQAVVVVINYSEFTVSEIKRKIFSINFPYIPEFLSFREGPLILEVFKMLKTKPDLLLVDGQGIAHPRKAGLAVYLGVELNLPTIGCAKRPLLKINYKLDILRGAKSPIYLEGDLVGYVVRTQTGVNPLFISPGNLITVEESVEWVLKTAIKFRLPEPLRLAHIEASRKEFFVIK